MNVLATCNKTNAAARDWGLGLFVARRRNERLTFGWDEIGSSALVIMGWLHRYVMEFGTVIALGVVW